MSRFCTAVALFASLLLLPTLSHAQSAFPPCLTNADNNATLVLPSSVSAALSPSDEPLSGGTSPDSIAAYTSDGECVGVTAWSASGTTLPVAGSENYVSGGVDPGGSLNVRVYDASREVVDQAVVEHTDCSAVSSGLQPLCRDDARYEENAIYVVEAIASQASTLRVEGSEGADGADAAWHFIGIPTASWLPAEDLRLGGEPPNFDALKGRMLLEWNDEAPSYKGPTGRYQPLSATDPIQPGRGYGLFLSDKPPYALDPSITIRVAGAPDMRGSETVTVDSLAQTARWHLLANPYPSAYDLSALTNLATNGFQSTVQRYDASLGAWMLDDQSSAELAGWEAFFIERTDYSGGHGATSLTFDPSGQTVDAPFVESTTDEALAHQRATLGMALHVTSAEGDTVSRDPALRFVFDERATTAWDPFDASKLTPFSSQYALLAPQGNRNGSVVDKAVESRPWPSTQQSIPLRLHVENLAGRRATISVDQWSLPDAWQAQLVDTHTGATVALGKEDTYSFTLTGDSTRTASRFDLQVTPSDSQLPVRMTSFQARQDERAIHLQWQTASETKNTGFRILRTSDEAEGRAQDWRAVGFVDGRGTTQEPQQYRFADHDVPYEADTLAYRLKQIDTDGNVHVSDTVTVARRAVQRVQLHGSFPNPARSQATIRYALPTPADVQLEVFDVLGRRTMTLAASRQEAGRHEIRADVSRLSSGIYFYRLQTDERSVTRKLTVVR